MGNYWGKVCIDRKGRARAFKLNGVTRRVFEEYNIPKFVKTKIAILDLMDERGELPCRSKKIEYMKFTSYWIYGPVLKYRPVRRGCGNDD